jgi:hypothetical protein
MPRRTGSEDEFILGRHVPARVSNHDLTARTLLKLPTDFGRRQPMGRQPLCLQLRRPRCVHPRALAGRYQVSE